MMIEIHAYFYAKIHVLAKLSVEISEPLFAPGK